MLTPEKGARTQIWLASSPDVEGVSGQVLRQVQASSKPAARALDEATQQRLWDVTARLLGLGNAAETHAP